MKRHRLTIALATASLLMSGAAFAQRLVPPADLPQAEQSLQLTQSGDEVFRINELENQVRQLNGRVEELNFLLLQLQEKLRKMEEDNELRFQELEGNLSDDDKSQDVAGNDGGESSLEKPEPSVETTSPDGTDDAPEQTARRGSLPRALGTLTFDENGNVIDSKPQGPALLNAPDGAFDDASEGVEAAQFGATPNEVFRVGKNALDARNYPRSAIIFASFLKAWPKDPAAGAASYYMAESLFWQKKYYQAADIHLNTHRDFPESETAADNLLGLGLSLAGLNQREVACATYAEVLQQYPDATNRLAERIKDEQAAAKC